MDGLVGRNFFFSGVILLIIASGAGQARQGQQTAQGQQTGQGQQQAGQGQQPPGQGRAQTPPQNLKVLPKNLTRPQVTALMRTFTVALGVQCTHCHAGTPPQLNYAADEKPTKEVARKMIHMVMHINEEHLKGIGSPTEPAAAPAAPPAAGGQAPVPPPPLGDGPQKVTCFTCHRGQLKPATSPGGGN
jgi:photosynthetic reaction center cytochrome c subunit